MRMQFSCAVSGSGVKLHIGAHQGTYKPWWSQLRIELYGQDASKSFSISGTQTQVFREPDHHRLVFAVADNGQAQDIEVSAQ